MQEEVGVKISYGLLSFFIVLAISVLLLMTWLTSFSSQDAKTMDITLGVSNYTALGNNGDVLSFGTTPPNTVVHKTMSIKNAHEQRTRIVLTISGEIKNWVYTSDNDFILEGNSSRKITVQVKVPENATYGNYSSKLHIKLR